MHYPRLIFYVYFGQLALTAATGILFRMTHPGSFLFEFILYASAALPILYILSYISMRKNRTVNGTGKTALILSILGISFLLATPTLFPAAACLNWAAYTPESAAPESACGSCGCLAEFLPYGLMGIQLFQLLLFVFPTYYWAKSPKE